MTPQLCALGPYLERILASYLSFRALSNLVRVFPEGQVYRQERALRGWWRVLPTESTDESLRLHHISPDVRQQISREKLASVAHGDRLHGIAHLIRKIKVNSAEYTGFQHPEGLSGLSTQFSRLESLTVDLSEPSGRFQQEISGRSPVDPMDLLQIEKLRTLRLRGLVVVYTDALTQLRRRLQMLELTRVAIPDLDFLRHNPFKQLVKLALVQIVTLGGNYESVATLRYLQTLRTRRASIQVQHPSFFGRLSRSLHALDLRDSQVSGISEQHMLRSIARCCQLMRLIMGNFVGTPTTACGDHVV